MPGGPSCFEERRLRLHRGNERRHDVDHTAAERNEAAGHGFISFASNQAGRQAFGSRVEAHKEPRYA